MTEYSLRELECFLAVAEELSFTRAAERLRLAQPPLSRHIANLEEKLGVILFERSRRHVALTPAGRAFRSEAGDIVPQLRRAGEAARRAAQGETKNIEVGFVSAVLSPELVEVFTGYRKTHPDVQLNLHDLLPSDQLDALSRGDLDVGFIGVAPEKLPNGLSITKWRDEELMAFLPPDDPRSGQEAIRLDELADDPFVMISPEAAPSYNSFLHRICREAGFRPAILREARRAQAVAASTVVGSGVAILPASLDRITKNGIPLRRSRRWATKITHSVAHRSQTDRQVEEFLASL